MNSPSWRVLIVDDNFDDRADVRRMLLCGSDRRYVFVETELGRSCLKLIRDTVDTPPDCVVLDFYLPDMDALEVLAALRDEAGYLPCAVMVITGSDRSRGPEVVRAGAQDYLGKNVLTPESLTRGVENSIERFALLTERKRIESELKLALSTAENASNAKTAFLSSMSHELRSPLNAILGFAQLINSSASPPTPQQRESVEQILKAGWYLLELINEILDLATIESGKISLSLEPLSLEEVLRDCEAMIEPQARARAIRLTFAEIDKSLRVAADRVRIKQVFINILSNAIKYNRAGGAVRVTCSATDAEHIRISFEDTGAGLPPHRVANLFQPFERHGQEVGGVEGTGIGLVVSKRLVELMSGRIGAQSAVGVGSLFWVEFEATVALDNNATAPSIRAGNHTEQPSGAPMLTVLCVEDNPANLKLVERILARRSDVRLLAASDGHRGIEVARDAHPDVVLMDINLPGISGIEALNLLTQDPATAGIPVIAISANAMPRDIEKGLQAGFFSYLTKPIEIERFNAALDAALTFSRRACSPSTIEVNRL